MLVQAENHLNKQVNMYVDGVEKLVNYTDIFETTDLSLKIDFTPFQMRENIDITVIPHDSFNNKYYYPSNTLTLEKPSYGKPKVIITPMQEHSERGKIKIKYEHDDATLQEDGSYITKDGRKCTPDDFQASVDIYVYVDSVLKKERSTVGIPFKLGEERIFDYEFSDISPAKRSRRIYYYVVATDSLTGIRSSDWTELEVEELDDIEMATEVFHYYNDEPFDPDPGEGAYTNEDDSYAYKYAYVNIEWLEPTEPDEDEVMYYVYLRTPSSLGEPEKKITIKSRFADNGISYTRLYKILVKEDNDGSKLSELYYINEDTGEEEWIKTYRGLGFSIDYMSDHLGQCWPILEEYNYWVVARDIRDWDNSYYGVSPIRIGYRDKFNPPHEVQLKVIDNLEEGDGENVKLEFTYTHPRGNVDGTIDIYAYQEGVLRGKVYSIKNVEQGTTQVANINFKDFELKEGEEHTDEKFLIRGKEVSYYAVATDEYIFKNSLENFGNIPLEFIPRAVDFNADGLPINIERIIVNVEEYPDIIDGTEVEGCHIFDFNDSQGIWRGPYLRAGHYFNEEPPSTIIEEFDTELVPFNTIELKWPHVADHDGHPVHYEIYIASVSRPEINGITDTFYNDDEDQTNKVAGEQSYNKVIVIPESQAFDASIRFSSLIPEYQEDELLKLWIVTCDPYKNSYYRASNLYNFKKGHVSRPIRNIYPCNGSIVYSQRPRIVIELGEDTQKQTTYVQWMDAEYNNKDNPELFSNIPNRTNVTVFKPPVPFTTEHETDVNYSVYAYNGVNYTDKVYSTYTYRDIFRELTDNRLIPIKSAHMNIFRNAIQSTRLAYGLPIYEYTRQISKNMIFENFDFNETKDSIMQVNDFINHADASDLLDYNNNLIVDVKDLDVTEYKGEIGAISYEEFLEWGRLLYILEDKYDSFNKDDINDSTFDETEEQDTPNNEPDNETENK